MINKKLVNGGKVERWACLNFSKVPASTVKIFCSKLIKTCNFLGMDFKERPLVPLWSINDLNIAAALKSIHSTAKEQLQLLIVILPEERGNYGMKLLMLKNSVLSVSFEVSFCMFL
jgi:eukaryotic translation initiation factor 2C